MSDSWILVIPTDPTFTPSLDAASRSKVYLSSILPVPTEVEVDIEVEFFDEVRFIDAGENSSGVACPYCGLDAEDWWFDAVEMAFKESFTNLTVETPCCGRSASLNDLRYEWAVGFSKFALSAQNAGIKALSDEQLDAIANILGHPVRQVLRHI